MNNFSQIFKNLFLNRHWRFNILLILLLLIFFSLSKFEQKNLSPEKNITSTSSPSLSIDLPSTPVKNEQQTTTLAKINVPEIQTSNATNNQGSTTTIYHQVAHVVDGDTIDVNIDGQIARVRLIGINTPEVVDPRKPVQCFGKEASEKTKELLNNKKVRLEADSSQDEKDKYGRLLRYVWREDGLFYNLEIIKIGYAFEYTYFLPYKYQSEFKSAQNYASSNKLGLWADNTCGGQLINAGEQSFTRLQISTSSNGCLIKGNINAKGEKIYHLPNCPYYKQTAIEESKGEKWFCTEKEAIAAGWRKALNCL